MNGCLLKRAWFWVIVPLLFLSLNPIVSAFHFPWDQGHDTFTPDDPDDDTDPDDDDCNKTGCPVEVQSGNFIYKCPDLLLPGQGLSVKVIRTYNSRDMRTGPFGHGWTFSYDYQIVETTDGDSRFVLLHKPNGKRERFKIEADGSIIGPPDGSVTVSRLANNTFALTDAAQNQYEFNILGKPVLIRSPSGKTITFGYDDTGFLIQIIDPMGRVVTLTKGVSGKIQSLRDPAGRIFRYVYDEMGNLTEFIDPAAGVTRYAYDSLHNLISVSDPAGGVLHQLTYDSANRVASFTEPGAAEVWQMRYFPEQNRTTKSDSAGNTWIFIYNENGNVTRRTDPLGKVEEFGYDAGFRLVSFKDRNGNSTLYDYDSNGNLASVTDALGSSISFGYTSSKQIGETQNRLGNSTRYEYDGTGNLSRFVGASGSETRFVYNAQNQLVGYVGALQKQSTFTYDQFGYLAQATLPSGAQRQFQFDVGGNLTQFRDPNGMSTFYTYASNYISRFGEGARLTAISNAIGSAVRYEYDLAGNLSERVDGLNRRTKLSHDANGRLLQMTNPLGQRRSYTYDSKGQVLTSLDPKGQSIRFYYDVLGRVMRKELPNETYEFAYDSEGNTVEVKNSLTIIRFTYDALHRLVEETTSIPSIQQTNRVRYSYDANDNKLSLTDSEGGVTQYTYDADERLVGILTPRGVQIQYAYDAEDRRVRLTRSGGISTRYGFDDDDRLTELTNSAGGSPVSSFSYAYDLAGNRTAVRDRFSTHTYAYDGESRLRGASHTDGRFPSESYSYDAAGNRTASHLSALYRYDDADRLLEDQTFDYQFDENGNLTQRRNKSSGLTTRYSYDAEDQLVRVELPDNSVVIYRYDALGRRCEKSVNGIVSRFVYDGENIISETDATGQIIARYTHGPGTRVTPFLQGPGFDEPLLIEQGGVAFHIHHDGVGNVTEVTDAAGRIVNEYLYDSFGRLLASTETVRNPFTYRGREFDRETGFYYNRARYYNPQTGRFLTEDLVSLGSIRSRAGNFPTPAFVVLDTGNQHLYAYVDNNPINYGDPLGFGGSEHGKLPGTDIPYRIDWKEQPSPDMHIRWKDGSESNITHEGGWRQGMHRGRKLVPPPQKYRKPLRKVVKQFVKKAGKLVPVVGIAFWLLDADEAYALSQDPCSGAGDYVNIIIPYKDIGELFK